jgi:CRP-like cAMP-binding protein
MPAHTKLWYFEQFRMLATLTDAQRRHLERMTRMLEVKRGTPIYLPGDPSDQIYLLKSGVIKISTTTPDHREVILAFLHPGDIFGELAVVDESPRDHVAEAYDDCVICTMDRNAVMRLIRETPDVGFQITKLIGLRVRTLRSRVEELLYRSAHARVALLELSSRHGVTDGDGVLLSLRLSQRDLGRLVGLSGETVNAILQEWREQQLVEMDRRSVRLRHPDRLRRIAAIST